ncbi:DEAD-box ATP-dependent RNA helicase 58, chloroplastic isoform X1 [Herrania umbratica]|uniref:RNA helicase n=2 Tax=Herrania umbratica TaxID=108875 RepID=A0A6J1AWL2_9ROSI|nr:DEAD-box ATP-dependent RNA helicase 58, chloroplastic isoform X1 [Herrania umbratica]
MASSTSATVLLSLTITAPSPEPTTCRCLLQPRNRYLNLSSSANYSNKALFSSYNSNSFPLSKELETNCNSLTLREICQDHVPDHVLGRMEELGHVMPTDVQREALPVLFSGNDCILHAQTGSGKTLTYLLLIYSVINPKRSAVQALIVVPTRELGMQVTKVARMLAAKPMDPEVEQKSYTVMALLDGGMLRRHKSWLKAEPPNIVVATIGSLSQMLEKQIFKLDSMRILVVDEVDFIFNSSKQVSSIRKLLTSYSSCNNRQTVFASASIPQHRRFLHDCIQQKWTKGDVVHVHVNPVKPMPSCLLHRFVICGRKEKHRLLLSLLQSDLPESGIIFVNEQSEKSKKAGKAPSTTLLIDFLKASYGGSLEIILLEDNMNFNSRAASLSEVRQGGGHLLVSTDIAARGIDLPEITHIYNFDLPKTAIDYLHRAGRTGRKPFSHKKCTVSNIILSEECFVLQRYENELMFNCEELILETLC